MATSTPVKVPAIDYTSRDFRAISADMIGAIPLYTPEWTDHNDTDFGIVTVKSFAAQLDVLHFYVDRAAGELYPATAVKRESVVKAFKIINYELRSVIPASTDVVLSIQSPLAGPLLIPKGTKVQTFASLQQAPVQFETVADLTIPAGNLSGTVSVVEGETDSESLDPSTGQAFQQRIVTALTVIVSTLQIIIDEGGGPVVWELVPDFSKAGPSDKVYRIELDANEQIHAFFGDNLQGKIPVPGASIDAAFRKITGDRGGVFGNVGANTITIFLGTVLFGGNPVAVAVNNPGQASGGQDVESISEAKRLGPASLRALNRAVTPEDYKTLAQQFGGVAKALVTQGAGQGDPCCACNLNLYVAPTGGGTLSTSAKQDLLDFLDDKKMVGTCIQIQDPTYVGINIQGSIFVFSNFDLKTTQDSINTALNGFFDLAGDFADFGRDLFLGNLFSQLEAVAGIDHVDITQCSRVPQPSYDIWTGNGTINTPTIGPASQDETWTVTFLSPTTFSVVGAVSGIQPNGTIGVAYATPNGALHFTITAGVTPQQLGDRITFQTSTFLGNVPIDNTEIISKGSVSLTFVIVAARLTGVNC